MPDLLSTAYINSVDYDDLADKLKELKSIIDDQTSKIDASRKLRYAEVDIEAEREAGRFAPDELYVPLHICDTNIRREQSSYVQYITQSPRAIILTDQNNPSIDYQPLEKDLTAKIRYEGWQLPMFSNIDGFQANGYGIMEIVPDNNSPGHIGCECVQYCDFGFISDTRDIQAVEMTARAYYYTRTRLLALCGDGTKESDWDRYQVEKIISKNPEAQSNSSLESLDPKDKSLFKVLKFMFRVNGVVHTAFGCPETCDDWVRKPRPLFIGRKKAVQMPMGIFSRILGGQPPTQWQDAYETNFPYVMFPYLISENDTISQLKGRIFLDQDLQEAASSLLSSLVTQSRRASGLYFCKDSSDPNDDLLMQKNIYLRQGCLFPTKVQQMSLASPDPSSFSAVNLLMSANQSETSQVSFATNNRKDSRKTAKEIAVSEQQEQRLSTVQVVLFSIALTQLYRVMVDVIKSRVLSGILQVSPVLKQLYSRSFTVKPSGDIDVIQKQELIQKMMNAWPVIQNTPLAQTFLMDLLQLMFPDRFQKYEIILQQAQQQQQSAQAQQQQQLMATMQQMANGLLELAKHKEFFSDIGQLHAYPVVQQAAEQIKQMEKANGQAHR